MNHTKRNIIWLIVFLGADIIGLCSEPFAKGPYLGQIPPGPVAKVFAPGLICDTRLHRWESHGSFSADGNTFCYVGVRGVFITENTDQGWTTPKRIKSIPTDKFIFSPCVSPDANSIYFMYSYDRSSGYNPFRCQRTSDGWSSPQKVEPIFNYPGLSHGGFSFAADNSIYVFITWQKAEGRVRGTFYVPYVNNTWARAVKLSVDGGAPGIAPDESFMVFNAPGLPDGLGATDLYLILRRPDGSWTKAQNLGPRINSAYYEYAARISSDKKYMFFTRANGWGENSYRDTADIYWVELKEYLPESYR